MVLCTSIPSDGGSHSQVCRIWKFIQKVQTKHNSCAWTHKKKNIMRLPNLKLQGLFVSVVLRTNLAWTQTSWCKWLIQQSYCFWSSLQVVGSFFMWINWIFVSFTVNPHKTKCRASPSIVPFLSFVINPVDFCGCLAQLESTWWMHSLSTSCLDEMKVVSTCQNFATANLQSLDHRALLPIASVPVSQRAGVAPGFPSSRLHRRTSQGLEA